MRLLWLAVEILFGRIVIWAPLLAGDAVVIGTKACYSALKVEAEPLTLAASFFYL